MLWTRGVAARETLRYLERRGIDTEPSLLGAGISRSQLSQDDIGLSVGSQYRFLELAAAEADDSLLGLHVAAEMDIQAVGILFYLTGSSRTVSEALEAVSKRVQFRTSVDSARSIASERMLGRDHLDTFTCVNNLAICMIPFVLTGSELSHTPNI